MHGQVRTPIPRLAACGPDGKETEWTSPTFSGRARRLSAAPRPEPGAGRPHREAPPARPADAPGAAGGRRERRSRRRSGGLGSLAGLGGLGGLVSAFTQNGLGDVIGSWIGRGQNLPVSGSQLAQVLGPDAVRQLAGSTGASHAEVTTPSRSSCRTSSTS